MALKSFIQENGYEPAGVAYERYLNSPQDTDPQALQSRSVPALP
jgi:effector-binding domain-containing protein